LNFNQSRNAHESRELAECHQTISSGVWDQDCQEQNCNSIPKLDGEKRH